MEAGSSKEGFLTSVSKENNTHMHVPKACRQEFRESCLLPAM